MAQTQVQQGNDYLAPKLEVSEYRDSFELWPSTGAPAKRIAIFPFDGNKEQARADAEMFARLYEFAHRVWDFSENDSAGHMQYLHKQAQIALGECCPSLYARIRLNHCCEHSYLLPCPRCEAQS